MKKLISSVMLLLSLTFVTSCSNNEKASEEVTENKVSVTDTSKPEEKPVVEDNKSDEKLEGEIIVGAAASLTDAFNDIIKNFEEKHPGVKIQTTYGGSGSIQSQIEEGAPMDFFISAAEKQMDALEEKDLIDKDTRVDFLENKVVLITPTDSDLKLESFEDVANNENVNMVAIGEVESVPVGQYTKEIFENLKVWDKVEAKANWAKDVRQVLDWVSQKESPVGIVYKTDAFTEKDNVKIVTEAPEGTHKPVIYPMAVLKNTQNEKLAKAFEEYLKTDESKKILEDYGFEVK